MYDVLEGVKVLEVSAWAFVPSAGAVLADWGAEVLKVEPPTGDPMRGLVTGGMVSDGPTFTWEIWNRGKRSIALDLTEATARDIVLDLAAEADVFLTSYLPATRAKLGLDLADVQARNPNIVFACGTGFGAHGEEAGKGGYDAISFWARGGIAAGCTPADYHRPVAQPSGAFGDSISGMALAGGIAGALLRRERTGRGAVVDVSLLGTAMWSTQMSIVGAAAMGITAPPPPPEPDGEAPPPAFIFNALVNNYRTSDGRWLALCMLQFEQYVLGVLEAIGRPDLAEDPRFATPEDRQANQAELVRELEAVFATQDLAHWRAALATQPGQWDVVTHPTELAADPQALANGYVQPVGYPGGASLPLVSSPVQFDRVPPTLRPPVRDGPPSA